ncbi:serine/threonine-protein kinase [Tautonia rosea]|uniref:serine/threonine-protein kinase n=1 Tax=Tautonia rosea TaxID=2728037 RepID=UPI00147296E7|nr:serine/threonine-protein kinase [Tautonia rosea]
MIMNCPGHASLRGFLQGEASETEAEAIETHLDDCESCQALLHRWTDLDPELRGWLVEIDLASPVEEDPVEQGLGDRLRAALHHRTDLVECRDGQDTRSFPDRVGPYRIDGRAGVGGMSTVFEATDTRLGRRVALKMILAADEQSRPVLDRFQREGAVLAALNHPNIVPVYEVGDHDGQPYLVLEFVPGGTLAQRLEGRPLAPRLAARAVATLAGAVQYAHEQGVIHRDLKPSNILLKPEGGRAVAEGPGPIPLGDDRLMIVDFGLARWQHDLAELTRSGQPIGTPAYMAPEQAAARADDIGPPADLYALGVILYELLTGRPPFQGENVASTLRMVQESEAVSPRDLQPGVPRDLETITLKCLEKEPRRRYLTAGALADDLERFLENRPIVARPIRPAGRAWRWCRRNPGFASVGMLAGLLLVALVVGSVVFAIVEADLRRQADLRERQALQNAAEARAARDLASLSLQRTLVGYTTVVDGVLAISPFDNPKVRSVRDTGHQVLSDWCVEYLDSLPPGASWTIADLQVALTLARVRFDLGRVDEAEPLLARAWEAARRLDGFDRSDPEAMQLLIVTAMRLGNTLNQNDHPRDAVESYELSDRVLEAVLRVQPGETYYLDMRFSLLGNLARTLSLLGRTEEAIQAEREGLRMLEALVETRPGDANHPIELGLRSARLGKLHLDSGQWEDAWSVLSSALNQLELVPDDSPRMNQVRRAQLNGLRARARAGFNLGRFEAVVPDLEAALSLTSDPRAQWELQIQRIEARFRAGMREGAVEAAEALLADPEAVAAFPLEIANIFALLAEDPNLSSSAQESLVDKAVGLIKSAQSAGRLKEPGVIEGLFLNPDLASLRSLLESL